MRGQSRTQHVVLAQALLAIRDTKIKQPLHIVLVGNPGRRLEDPGAYIVRRQNLGAHESRIQESTWSVSLKLQAAVFWCSSRRNAIVFCLVSTLSGVSTNWTEIVVVPGTNGDTVENTTLEWVDWFNNHRLLESIGNVPPAEFEAAYYHQQEESAMVA